MLNPVNQDAPWRFGTKAQTLATLYQQLVNARVLPSIIVSHREFINMDEQALDACFASLKANVLIVRSAYSAEDSASQSCAGMFTSISQVADTDSLRHAIDEVFNSYPKGFADTEHVLIQPMLGKVAHCGVMFTCEQRTGAPYYVMSDDCSGKTDVVTAGHAGQTQTMLLRHDAAPSHPLFKKLLPVIRELMAGFANDALDIEYAIDHTGKVTILQVRPLLCEQVPMTSSEQVLEGIKAKLTRHLQPHPFLHGDNTIFGVMPDWNPAEIIGLTPKPLALSLYKNLITDSIWAYQRNNYGYKNLRSFPLLIDFAGLPYIDVRVSFNSFLPKDLPKAIGDKLVNGYLQALRDNPNTHDRVEFDIVLSCYTPDIASKHTRLKSYGLDEQAITVLNQALLQLTNRIIDPRGGLWIQDLHRIETLKARHQTVMQEITDPIMKTYWLLEDCKRYGTLPFAGLARAGFIAVQFINAMVAEGILTDAEHHAFQQSLNTVSSQMQYDLMNLSTAAFLAQYGHLRPGTYDVCSARYDHTPDAYFSFHSNSDSHSKTARRHAPDASEPAAFALSADTYQRIHAMLQQHNINHTAQSLLHFIRSAIEGREYAKFVFSRSLSDAMECFVALGEQHGFSRDDMAFANIGIIHQFVSGGLDISAALKQAIDEGKQQFAVTQQIKLPTLLFSEQQVDEFTVNETTPSFITQQTVTGAVCADYNNTSLSGKIVLITNADPGFDWLFSHNIKGFVTAFGGCNSHMAIRAAELNIPAVIGAGEHKFAQWQQAAHLTIDCASQTVKMT